MATPPKNPLDRHHENEDDGLWLINTFPFSFPLEFTNIIPREVTVESSVPKAPQEALEDIDAIDRLDQEDPAAAKPADPHGHASVNLRSMDRYSAHGLNEPVVHRRVDGSKIWDTHPLEDPSDKCF